MPKRKRKTGDQPRRDRAPAATYLWRRPAVSIAAMLMAAGGAVLVAALLSGTMSSAGPSPVTDPPSVSAAAVEIPPRPPVAPLSDSSPDAAAVAALRDETFDIAERAVKALPNNPDALCLLGSVHYRYASDDAAVGLWQQCLQLDPRFADAHHSLGMRANAAGDFAAAEKHLLAALRIDPAWAEVPLPLAQALVGQSKFRETVALLEPFVQANPASGEGWCRLGQAYHQLGDHENARRCHLDAVAANPRFTDAHHGAALAFEKLVQTKLARQHFDEFRKLRDAEQRANRDQQKALTDEGRLRTTAVKTCLAAGRVYLLHGLSQEAERHWRRAAALDPQDRESRESLCKLFAQQARLAEALPFRKQLCDLEPTNPRHWMSLGILYGRTRQPDEAEAAFRRVIELAPDESDGYAALAEIQMLPGRDAQEAVELAGKAVDLAPTARHHYVLATAHWNAGDTPSARAALEQAMRLKPDEAEYREAYARLAYEMSR